MPLKDFLKRLNILDPNNVRIIYDGRSDSLKLITADSLFANIIPLKPFPITYPNFIIFRDVHRNVDVGVLRDYEELDPDSKRNLQILLNKMYFIPKILKIMKIETSGDEFIWEIITDRGFRRFRTRGRMSIIQMGERVIITDTKDNVYEIENIWKMDEKSRREMESTL